MDKPKKLFCALLGGKPPDSTIEAHNVFFGVGPTLESLYGQMKKFWPSAPKIHIDAWMCIEKIYAWNVIVKARDEAEPKDVSPGSGKKLFFVNLGGYQQGAFEEFHKKILIVADDEASAVIRARQDPFFNKFHRVGDGVPHIDDRKTIDDFEEDVPIAIDTLIEKSGHRIVLKGIGDYRYGTELVLPEVHVTGFMRI